MYFLSAIEETKMPPYLRNSGWIELFDPQSMFKGALIAKGRPKLNPEQSECLLSIAALLDTEQYPTDEIRDNGGFELLFRNFIGIT
jgi:hypothetical protein